jgi:hypothetical protein
MIVEGTRTIERHQGKGARGRCYVFTKLKAEARESRFWGFKRELEESQRSGA